MYDVNNWIDVIHISICFAASEREMRCLLGEIENRYETAHVDWLAANAQ
jgi:hypothetical protein